MPNDAHQYVFYPGIAFEDVEASLLLAIFAAESLHGEAQVRLDVAHAVDSDHRTCLIDASTEVGRDLNQLFVGFVLREFGPECFAVQRVDRSAVRQPQEVQG